MDTNFRKPTIDETFGKIQVTHVQPSNAIHWKTVYMSGIVTTIIVFVGGCAFYALITQYIDEQEEGGMIMPAPEANAQPSKEQAPKMADKPKEVVSNGKSSRLDKKSYYLSQLLFPKSRLKHSA